MDLIRIWLRTVLFFLSTTPFDCGVRGAEKLCVIPLALQNSLNCTSLSNFLLWSVLIDTIEHPNWLVPSCFAIFDLEPLSSSFDFVFVSEIFKSLSFRLDRLCYLAILCLDQHAHTLHHLESLLTISLDRLDIFEGRSCISEFVRKSLSLILELS
ncbi:hypothetical protein Tco_1067768 [Tanacetum coccineum]|uniref:Secreted protein n=1 Tax=Tanacetum coccineum TaxID=301880 RepID=A0ABQ5HF93_9ASTR